MTHFCQVGRDINSQHNAVSSIKRKTDKLREMYSPLLIEKAKEAAQYSSEPLGYGRDAAAHTEKVFSECVRCVFPTLNVCEGEGEARRERRSDSVLVQAICPRLSAFIG